MAARGETRDGGGEGETETGKVTVLRVETEVYNEVGVEASGKGVEAVGDGCEME